MTVDKIFYNKDIGEPFDPQNHLTKIGQLLMYLLIVLFQIVSKEQY